MTQMQLLKGLGMGRRILWRIIRKNLITNDLKSIEKIEIETKEILEEEIITQLENYYFDVSNTTTNKKTLPEYIVYFYAVTKLCFPFELGWLHFTRLVDYEQENAGLGMSISYNALGIKSTIYLYDYLRSDVPVQIDSPIVSEEFEKANADLMVRIPAAKNLVSY